MAAQLTQEVWALSIDHTLVDLFQGIVWLLVTVAFLAFAAFVYLERSNMAGLLAERKNAGAKEKESVVTTR